MNHVITYSIVLPIYNEEACLEEILKRLDQVLFQLPGAGEIICVDDHSTDSSWALIQNCTLAHAKVKGIRFTRNFGHQAALFAGIKEAQGKYIALMDADGQDPPEFLLKLLSKINEGFDAVYAIRKKRKEHILKRLGYAVFYRIYRLMVPFDVPLDAGDFSVIRRNVADFIVRSNNYKPFIRGLRSAYGGKQCGLEYERPARLAGETKYSIYQLIILALNASISFSKFPLRIISLTGMIIAFLSFIGGLLLLYSKFFIGIDLKGWTSTAILIIFFGGLNLFVLGLIGEYIGSIFDEIKSRPNYLVQDTLEL